MRRLSLLALVCMAASLPAQELDVKKITPAWNLPWEEDWVTAVTFAGPSRRLVAGNERGDILMWELPDAPAAAAPLPSRILKGHTNGITRLRSSPDGRWVISASKDRTIRYWDMQAEPAETTEVILDQKKRDANAKKNGANFKIMNPVKVKLQTAAKVLEQHKEWILGLDLTPDGKTMISGDDSGRVIVWERESAKPIKEWTVKGWVHGLAISPDAKLAAVTEQRPLVFDSGRHQGSKIWDAVKGEIVKELAELAKENIGSAAFSPDGQLVAFARSGEADSGRVHIFDIKSMKKLKEIPAHMGGTNQVAFSASGKHLITCGRDTVVRIWTVADGKQAAELGKPRGGQFKDIMHAFAVTPDQRWIAGADMAGQVQVWFLGAAPAASAKSN